MDKARFTFLFQRYTEQHCTENERLELMRLIGSSSYDKELKSLIDELWQKSGNEPALSDDKAVKILDAILTTEKKTVPMRSHGRFTAVYKVAAAIALLILCGAALYFFTTPEPQNTLMTAQIEVPKDEHQFVKLPDGSTVILNAGSKLEYPDSFDDKTIREVFLTGEGYFDIKANPEKAFIVHTGKLKTTVLGTAFNIKAYPEDKSITVTVTRGKVKVSDDKNVIGIINPNQQITFNESSSQSAQQSVDSRNAIAWAEKDVFFDDITLTEAATQLEERFKVKVNFVNQRLKECRFTATFVKGETLEQILTVICEFNNAHYSYDVNGNVQIDGEGC